MRSLCINKILRLLPVSLRMFSQWRKMDYTISDLNRTGSRLASQREANGRRKSGEWESLEFTEVAWLSSTTNTSN